MKPLFQPLAKGLWEGLKDIKEFYEDVLDTERFDSLAISLIQYHLLKAHSYSLLEVEEKLLDTLNETSDHLDYPEIKRILDAWSKLNIPSGG